LSENRKDFPNALQHDLTLRPNECGGPLIDLDGKLVGVNIARGGRVKSYAIPTVDLKNVIEKLSDQGSGSSDVDLLEKELGSLDSEIDTIENKLKDIKKRREQTRGAIEKAKSSRRE
jgi:S1-C subfamily serine protease